jgi:hypothetical protein
VDEPRGAHGPKSRSREWSRPPEPPPAASGILVQSLHAATECEVDLARRQPGRAIGLRPWIPKQPLEYYSCATDFHPLTRTSPCEACSGFTHVTARWIAQPPKAAFVARLQSSQLPRHIARQLVDQPTTVYMEPTSIGDLRRRGALRDSG